MRERKIERKIETEKESVRGRKIERDRKRLSEWLSILSNMRESKITRGNIDLEKEVGKD